MDDTNYKKELEKAWKLFDAELKRKGEKLPNMDGGDRYWEGDATRKPIYLEDLSSRKVESVFSLLPNQTLEEFQAKFIKYLDEQELSILTDVYFYDRTYQQIADEYKYISKSSVRRIHDRALEKLRERMG